MKLLFSQSRPLIAKIKAGEFPTPHSTNLLGKKNRSLSGSTADSEGTKVTFKAPRACDLSIKLKQLEQVAEAILQTHLQNSGVASETKKSQSLCLFLAKLLGLVKTNWELFRTSRFHFVATSVLLLTKLTFGFSQAQVEAICQQAKIEKPRNTKAFLKNRNFLTVKLLAESEKITHF